MNSNEPFERRLAQVPQRPLPPYWRDQILTVAQRAQVPLAAKGSLLARIRSQATALLWPHPTAWAGLAAIWLLVLGLHWAGREADPGQIERGAPPSAQVRELLKEQEQLLAELAGPREKARPEAPKPAGSQPRSQKRQELFNA